jgi:6,7-dimethyl-8-ribityllumazine synthase
LDIAPVPNRAIFPHPPSGGPLFYHPIMSSHLPPRPASCSTQWRIAVVASLYNPVLVDGLVSHFQEELLAICPAAQITVHRVPGSFEVPLGVEIAAAKEGVDAVAAFGVPLQGATAHATLVAQTVTDALMQISLRRRLPVLHEILLVESEAQAAARCVEPELNRGTEAARAAVRMLRAIRTLLAQDGSDTGDQNRHE